MCAIDNNSTRIMAIVSGKGGSGKTMISACVTKIFTANKLSCLLIDADTATGGLTYYLGLKHVENISTGITDQVLSLSNNTDSTNTIDRIIQRIRFDDTFTSRFIGVGEHRKIAKSAACLNLAAAIQSIITSTQAFSYDAIIIDCRGGIDEESLSICRLADDIIIIVETDTTSFQATQHLVDVLQQESISYKLKGYIINKVFENPLSIIRNGTAAFKCQYLTAIPFNFEATRDFLIGNIPILKTTVNSQLSYGLRKAYPDLIRAPTTKLLEPADFDNISTIDPDTATGNVISSFIGIITVCIFTFTLLSIHSARYSSSEDKAMSVLFTTLAAPSIIMSIEPFRAIFGRAIRKAFSNLIKLVKHSKRY